MKRHHIALLVSPYLADAGFFCMMFAITRYMADHAAGSWVMGSVGAGVSVCLGGSSILFGRLSDRIGRWPVLTFASLMLVVAAIGCARTSWLSDAMYLWYGAAAAAMGAGLGPAYAWLSESGGGPARRSVGRVLILYCLSWNLGALSGQLASGWAYGILEDWPLRLAVGFACANVVAVQVAAVMRRGAAAPAPASPPAPAGDQLLASRFVYMAWLANISGAFCMSMILYLFPQVAVELGVPSDDHGLYLGVGRIVTIATYLLMFRFGFWRMRLSTAIMSQAIAAAGMIAIALARHGAWLLVGVIGVAHMMGYNYFAGMYYATRGSVDQTRGGFVGMHEASIAVGFASGTLLGGLLGEELDNVRVPYVLAAAILAVFAVIQVIVYAKSIRPMRRSAGAPGWRN